MDDLVVFRLSKWAAQSPNKKAWTFLDGAGEESECYSYLELEEITDALASHLLSAEAPVRLQQGDRVLLVFFPGLHFMISLLACFKAGIIAVPVFPPDPTKLKKDLHHFVSIQQSSGATTALTHGVYNFAKSIAWAKNIFTFSQETWPELDWFPVDSFIENNRAKKGGKPGVVYPKGMKAPLDTDIAFLQYTSGSTSEPKGVMISHRNLAHNEGLIVTELKANEDTINVSWLPQYHDMGLIGSYLGLLYCGGVGVYLSPISFLKDPMMWLRTISARKGTHTQAPNFAYPLSVRKFKELRMRIKSLGEPEVELDLSSVQHMINAAEPVDAMAIVSFYDTFKEYGLPEHVVIPTFGLAEHCVYVCSDGKQVVMVDKAKLAQNLVKVVGSSPTMREYSTLVKETLGGKTDSSTTQVIVGCGYPYKGKDVDVRIVDPSTREELDGGSSAEEWAAGAEGRVGEIWISSPSKAQGYWERLEQTKEEFQATIASGTDRDNEEKKVQYLRTGDLGFFFRRELFICGRIKDVIIVNGSNHYPQDIEYTAEKACDAYIRPGCTAAFAVRDDTDSKQGAGERLALVEAVQHYDKGQGSRTSLQASGTETLVYVAEVKPDVKPSEYKVVATTARVSIMSDHGLAVPLLVLVKPRTIPKTTSGKITRAGCKKALFGKTLQVVHVYYAAGTGSGVAAGGSGGSGVGTGNIDVALKGDDDRADIGGDSQENDFFIPPKLSLEELTALPRKEILELLEQMLEASTSTSSNPLVGPFDPDESLYYLGMDSMAMNQFKGELNTLMHAECIPDRFLAHPTLATLNGLSLALKQQGLTPQQEKGLQDFEAGKVVHEDGSAEMIKEPYCPWWTCCYD